MNYLRERILWQQADRNRWLVARKAYHLPNRIERLKLADAIGRKEDTVDSLAHAYGLFRMLVKNAWAKGESSGSVRNLRRKYPYTRWDTVYRMWYQLEFSIDEAREWLENFEGGNDAMAAEIENKHGEPEWVRRANKVYREADKLAQDISTPKRLQRAAAYYMKVFDAEFPKVTK